MLRRPSHRTEDPILCYYLVCEEGSDDDIKEALGLKVSQFTGIMGDKLETEEDRVLAQTVATEHMHLIVEKLKASEKSKEKKVV